MTIISIFRGFIRNPIISLRILMFKYNQNRYSNFLEGFGIGSAVVMSIVGIINAVWAYDPREQFFSLLISVVGQSLLVFFYWFRIKPRVKTRREWSTIEREYEECRRRIWKLLEDPNWRTGDAWKVGSEKESLGRDLDRILGTYELWLVLKAEKLSICEQKIYANWVRDKTKEVQRIREEIWPPH